MTCREAAIFVGPYVDGELDVTHTTLIAAHLAACSVCTRAAERHRAWTRVVQQAPRYRASEALATRVRASLAPTQQRRPKFAPATWLAIAATLVLSASMTWWLFAARRSADSDLIARDIVASHIRSLMAQHLTDVPSSDRHTVKPWFAGKVPYALAGVPDLTTEGFTLEGGRLDYIANRSVAALVYRRRQHVINLYVWPPGPQDRPENTTRQAEGYETIAWTAHGQQHWAVSDVNDADLRTFVTVFQRAE